MSGRNEQLAFFGPPVPADSIPTGQESESPEDEGVESGHPEEQPGPADGGWLLPPEPAAAPVAATPVAVPRAPSTPSPGVAAALEALAAEAIDCRRCGLRSTCRGVVFGEGDPESGIVFLGEGPGAVEDQLGRPFVGPAGQLLDKILIAVGFGREDVYITNTVLCRPPGNRVPQPGEIAACRRWLDHRLEIMRPRIVVCLGASAGRNILGPDFRITRDRGRWYDYPDERFPELRLLATFHPAALLRDPSKKRPVWEDMKLVRAEWLRLRGLSDEPQRQG